MSGETSVENVLLKFAIDTFPKYISEIRDTYIYDAKCADVILTAPDTKATTTVRRADVSDIFGKLQSPLCSRLDDEEEMSRYFADSTFPAYFNMFSSEEYCRAAADFIRSVEKKEPKLARALLASFIRHRFEFLSGVHLSYTQGPRDSNPIDRFVAAVEANIACLSQYHQDLLRAAFNDGDAASEWFAQSVLVPLVRVWFHPEESDDGLLASLHEPNKQRKLADLFRSSDEFPVAKLPKISVLHLEDDVYYFSKRDLHVMEHILMNTLCTDCSFAVAQGFHLLKHVGHGLLPSRTISSRDHADDPPDNFDSWMRGKALDIRLLKESAKCAKEWLSLVSEHCGPVSHTNR